MPAFGDARGATKAGRSVIVDRWRCANVLGRTNLAFVHPQRGADAVTVPGNDGVAEHLDTDEREEEVKNDHQRLERRQPPQESIHREGTLDHLAFRSD